MHVLLAGWRPWRDNSMTRRTNLGNGNAARRVIWRPVKTRMRIVMGEQRGWGEEGGLPWLT